MERRPGGPDARTDLGAGTVEIDRSGDRFLSALGGVSASYSVSVPIVTTYSTMLRLPTKPMRTRRSLKPTSSSGSP